MWLLLPLVLWPLIEIGLFVTLGGWLGLWPTLAWVVGTAVLGMAVIRRQGERARIAMRHGVVALSDPLSPMAQGAMTVAAGALLILPGFLTDALGFLLLIPPVRAVLVAILSRRMTVVRDIRTGRPDIIDGEFIEILPERIAPRSDAPAGPRPSGWTRD